MIASSRPLRFIVLVLGGWVAFRTVQLWPGPNPAAAVIPTLLDVIVPAVAAVPTDEMDVRGGTDAPFAQPAVAELHRVPVRAVVRFERTALGAGRLKSWQTDSGPSTMMVLDRAAPAAGPIGSSLPPESIGGTRPRLQASIWTIVRGDGAASPFAPQLGGSQAGMRLTYTLDDARRIALAGRLSTALGSRQREAAIGIDWQPTTLPIHLIAEQRIGIEGARGGPSIGVIAGLNPTPVAAGFSIEAYGQAGGIARGGRVEVYADGALRVVKPAADLGAVAIDVGAGAWGGAQRDAARVDVGPTAGASLPIGGKAVRFSADWRYRIAGDARPGSGPAVSIGTDF